MLKIGMFCSGNGTHLLTVKAMIQDGLQLDPVFFFSNRPNSKRVSEARRLFPEIAVHTLDHSEYVFYKEDKKRHDRVKFDLHVRQMMDYYELDLVLFLGYMRVVTPEFLDGAPPIINLHPSLLPSFKGAHAVKQALEYGVEYTGATAHYVTADLDGGPIIKQDVVKIYKGHDLSNLRMCITNAERTILREAIYYHYMNS